MEIPVFLELHKGPWTPRQPYYEGKKGVLNVGNPLFMPGDTVGLIEDGREGTVIAVGGHGAWDSASIRWNDGGVALIGDPKRFLIIVKRGQI